MNPAATVVVVVVVSDAVLFLLSIANRLLLFLYLNYLSYMLCELWCCDVEFVVVLRLSISYFQRRNFVKYEYGFIMRTSFIHTAVLLSILHVFYGDTCRTNDSFSCTVPGRYYLTGTIKHDNALTPYRYRRYWIQATQNVLSKNQY